MQASETQLFKLLGGQQHFMIPLFQRVYSWTDANWAILWKDILETYEGGGQSRHFLGSVVTKSLPATPEGVSPFLAIDGQQRLTTLTILLAALRDIVKATEPQTAEKLHELYLTNKGQVRKYASQAAAAGAPLTTNQFSSCGKRVSCASTAAIACLLRRTPRR